MSRFLPCKSGIILLVIVVGILCCTSQVSAVELRTVESSLSVSLGTTDFGDVKPDGSTVTTEIVMQYEYPLFFFPIPRNREPTSLILTIQSKPSWCQVTLDTSSFEIPVDTLMGATETVTANITAKITDANAPAFEEGTITINITAQENGNIAGSSTTATFSLSPQFAASLEATLSPSTINLSQGETSNLTMMITNMCNTQIKASVSLEGAASSYLSVTLPATATLGVGEQVSLSIPITAIASENDSEIMESMVFRVSYAATADATATGTPVDLAVVATIEQSTSEEYVDPSLAIIVIAVIFLLLIVVMSLLKRGT